MRILACVLNTLKSERSNTNRADPRGKFLIRRCKFYWVIFFCLCAEYSFFCTVLYRSLIESNGLRRYKKNHCHWYNRLVCIQHSLKSSLFDQIFVRSVRFNARVRYVYVCTSACVYLRPCVCACIVLPKTQQQQP